MKLFAKLMLAALVIAMLLPFTILKDENGSTLMRFSDFSLPDFSLPSISDDIAGVPDVLPGGDLLEGEDRFYQWYDAEGNIQFTTQPPPQGVDYEVRDYDPDTNVIQSVQLPNAAAEEGAEDEAAEKLASPEDVGNPYSSEAIEKLFEEAKNLEKVLGKRLQDQDAIVNQ